MISVLDVHKESVLALEADESGAEQGFRRLRASREVMQEYIARLPAGSTVIMESCYAWEYIYDLAMDAKMDVAVVDTGRLYPSGKPEKKSDLEDCRRILRLYKMGELPTLLAMDSRVRNQRDLLRHRNFITQKITAFRNRTHFIVDRLGLRLPTADLFGANPVDPATLPISRELMKTFSARPPHLEPLTRGSVQFRSQP